MRRLLRILFWGALLCLGAVFLAGTLLLQRTPVLSAAPPPTAEDVAATRKLVQNIRSAADTVDGTLRTGANELNSALRLGARFIPGFRGKVSIQDAHVIGTVSIPVPWWDGQRWLNAIGRAPEFEGRIAPSEIFVADYSLPPGLVMEMARIGANLVLGNALGDTVLNAAQAMTIEEDALAFRLDLDEMGKNGVMRGTFGALKGDSLPTAAEIETFHVMIREAMETGTLSETGSFLPYLKFTLTAALEGTTPETLPGRYTAAILGLAKACGAKDFALIVGRLVFEKEARPRDNWSTRCVDVTFNGRIDSRRHFLTSAALQAISNTGFAVSAGEFKELYDTISGAGGFDFTDMTANLSGIRLSNVLMARPAADWPALLAQLQAEGDVIPSFDGIPQLMPEEEFKSRFGDIDSTAYREMIARIETRIDALSLYIP